MIEDYAIYMESSLSKTKCKCDDIPQWKIGMGDNLSLPYFIECAVCLTKKIVIFNGKEWVVNE